MSGGSVPFCAIGALVEDSIGTNAGPEQGGRSEAR